MSTLDTVAIVIIAIIAIVIIIIEFPFMLGGLIITGRTQFVSIPFLSVATITGAIIAKGDNSRSRCYLCWNSNKCVSRFSWL